MRVIGGTLGGRTLLTREGIGTRPPLEAVRQAVFNMMKPNLEGARILDLFAGSGSMGIEAISRGAKHATFVEGHRGAFKCLSQNLNDLNLGEQSKALCSKIPKCLSQLPTEPYDIIFSDPPFDDLQRGLFLDLETHLLTHLRIGGLYMVRVPERCPTLPPNSNYKLIKERRYGISVVLIKERLP
jgi:16S rRNA (guanine966-N2)-methyltransferase